MHPVHMSTRNERRQIFSSIPSNRARLFGRLRRGEVGSGANADHSRLAAGGPAQLRLSLRDQRQKRTARVRHLDPDVGVVYQGYNVVFPSFYPELFPIRARDVRVYLSDLGESGAAAVDTAE
jgi:hypothetical protein